MATRLRYVEQTALEIGLVSDMRDTQQNHSHVFRLCENIAYAGCRHTVVFS